MNKAEKNRICDDIATARNFRNQGVLPNDDFVSQLRYALIDDKSRYYDNVFNHSDLRVTCPVSVSLIKLDGNIIVPYLPEITMECVAVIQISEEEYGLITFLISSTTFRNAFLMGFKYPLGIKFTEFAELSPDHVELTQNITWKWDFQLVSADYFKIIIITHR